jgi:DNA modification methylase
VGFSLTLNHVSKNEEVNVSMKIEWQSIDEVKPYAGNPRAIPQSAIDRVAASIDEYGWRQPIVVDKHGVIAVGHTRWLAARKLGLDHVPVHVAEGLTPAQVRAYRIMDNRSHEETDWEPDLLKLEIAELKELDFPLDLTGFEPREIDQLLIDSDDDAVANTAPNLPSRPVTIPGDLWQCGGNRILCGDSTSAVDVARLLGKARPTLMSTDPPYGVSYQPEWREQAGLGMQRQIGKIPNDDRVDWQAAWDLFPGNILYIWHSALHAAEVALGIEAAGFEIRSQIIWAKPHFVLSRGSYHWQHEPCWFAVRKGQRSNWRGDRTQSTLWQVASLNPFGGNNQGETATGHAAQKPIELMRRPILHHTEPGDTIYDPFLGSGTSLIAAELTGRICHGIDIAAPYVDVSVLRWQILTGRSATLDGDGRSFEEVMAQRSAASTDTIIEFDELCE